MGKKNFFAIVFIESALLAALLVSLGMKYTRASKDFIKWVDFNVSYEALCAAYEYDVETYGKEVHISWIPLLAYTAARSGGEFTEKSLKVMEEAKDRLLEGEVSMKELSQDLENYDYFLEVYDAVLHEYVGEYEGGYGLKAYSPIAKGFEYSDYDDFGSSRDYGYARPHLGHDMMGLIGTPIIAVEGGKVEALGWNQYGGWRIGIRSLDKKRYYYYAHLRQNSPYAEGLKEGSIVKAGDVIGYMGHTGYSTTENVNNIKTVHLHFGLELVFDESQKESDNEIWIDCYDLVRFLSRNRSEVRKIEGTKEWERVEEPESAEKSGQAEEPESKEKSGQTEEPESKEKKRQTEEPESKEKNGQTEDTEKSKSTQKNSA